MRVFPFRRRRFCRLTFHRIVGGTDQGGVWCLCLCGDRAWRRR